VIGIPIRQLLSGLILMSGLAAQDLSRLPDWARPHAEALSREPQPPQEADAWVLFDRTEVAYTGDGEIRTRRFRLVKVLADRGADVAVFVIHGLGGKSSRVKRMKAWNLRPDGELTRLDEDRIITVDNASQAEASTDTLTAAVVPRVMKGSLVAFESLQVIQHPLGPIATASVMEKYPIRRWELEVAKKEGWFTDLKRVEILLDARHFEPWIQGLDLRQGQGLAANAIPPIPKDELFHPNPHNVLPWALIRFLDPDLVGMTSWKTWDAHATWMYQRYSEAFRPGSQPDLKGAGSLEALRQLCTWMARELHYKAVYLTPERGWVPLPADEVGRRQYGDCKDLACFFLAHAQRVGFQPRPVLARIVEGEVEEKDPPSPVFNHVICALGLDRTLGLPAEVETARGRFLLFDPTDRFTPLGKLGAHHRGRRLLVCTPEGGIWVEAPSQSIQESKVAILWTGDIEQFGRMKARLRVQEQGSGWGLREVTQVGGAPRLKAFLQERIFELPPTAVLTIGAYTNPLNLEVPFDLELDIQHPEGLKVSGNEGTLTGLGLRVIPAQAQKPGNPRLFPLERFAEPDLDFEIDLHFARPCQPLLPAQDGSTPFRTYSWRAIAEPEAAGSRLKIQFRHRSQSAFYGFDQRNEGVAAAKKDRTQIRKLMADGLTWKLLP